MQWLADHLALIMFGAMFVVVFCGYPVAFVLGGLSLLFALLGAALGVFPLVGLQNIILRVWGGVAVDPVLVAVPMFIFMGTLLERSGAARDMLDASQRLLGAAPGGLAIAVLAMGTMLAASIGVVGASVVLLALIGLPRLLDRGYDRRLAVGTVGAAGTLGILIPPSIMLVVMAEMLSTSAGALFAAATVPGLMLAGLYLLYIVALASLAPARAPRLAPADAAARAGLAQVLWRGLFPMAFLMVAVLGSIFAGWATATESAGVGVLGAMAIAAFNRRLSPAMLREAAFAAARANAMVFLIFVGATGFSFVFRILGGDELMLDTLGALGIDTKWEILGFVMALIFLLGFPFEWIEICLIVLPVFVPILQRLDFSEHIGAGAAFMPWFATLVAVNLQTSFMTPPFGGTLFYLKGTVPPSVSMNDIYAGMTPFVLLQVLALALCMAFPGIALWLPRVSGLLQ